MATYRRNTGDIEEAKYIAGLIAKDVAEQSKALAQSNNAEDRKKVFTLFGYEQKWNGIVADLTAEGIAKGRAAASQSATGTNARAARTTRPGGDAAPKSGAPNE